MTRTLKPDQVGLDAVQEAFQKVKPNLKLTIEPVTTILGWWAYAGVNAPLRSSAARLRVNDEPKEGVWIPAPLKPGNATEGRAPVYLHGGTRMVMPFIRLVKEVERNGPPKKLVSYLTLSDWLLDAIKVWKFTSYSNDTLWNWLQSKQRGTDGDVATKLARLICCALHGPRRKRKPWLRRIEGTTELAKVAATRMVITARVGKEGYPKISRSSKHRIDPACEDDQGIDPIHTPEDKDGIRIVGYLGASVGIEGRQLKKPPEGKAPYLSPSTIQIPFARYDEPRRLLMAANMQVQATDLKQNEEPVVRVTSHWPSPPGINLRTAYLAWKGLNHEDAWVISLSAAESFMTKKVYVHTEFIPATEEAPTIQVKVYDRVKKGQSLLRRSMSPIQLASEVQCLIRLYSHEEFESFEEQHFDGVTAKVEGIVTKIERWNLACKENLPPGAELSPGIRSRYREVLHIHIERTIPLEVGDKLANRHGHKGVVGRILPDEEMPRWRGKHLEVLIDPISVLNRCNWGQLYETLLGGLQEWNGNKVDASVTSNREELLRALAESKECREDGRSRIHPPKADQDWMREACEGIAGVQFVMRMPKHAADTLLADLPVELPFALPTSIPKIKRSRLGEQGVWAAWAHGLSRDPSSSCSLSAGSRDLQAALETAGICFKIDDGKSEIKLSRMTMDSEPPHCESLDEIIRLKKTIEKPINELAILRTKIEAMDPDKRYYLDLGSAIQKVRLPGFNQEKEDACDLEAAVRWLRIPPQSIRREVIQPNGSSLPHLLTERLETVLRKAIDWRRGRPRRGKAKKKDLEERLRKAIERLMKAAYHEALGWGCRYKYALLGDRILRPEVQHSGRAVIVPAGLGKGEMELTVNEVGLPHAVALAVVGKKRLKTVKELVKYCSKPRYVWIKRDPVLHRWGLLRMRVRLIEGNAIQLPPSVLGPLGGDFDGDCIAVFRTLPGFDNPEADQVTPSRIGWDELWERPMFLPSKQYIYGLHLLQRKSNLLAQMNKQLKKCKAPLWPRDECKPAKAVLEQWCAKASKDPSASEPWWAILEAFALKALSQDPGMGLCLPEVSELRELPPVQAGAAKKELFEGLKPGQEMYEAYVGQSLTIYRANNPNIKLDDTIMRVMAPSKDATPRFGNVPRKFINAVNSLNKEFIRSIHALSERATQKALSVKAGGKPLEYKTFQQCILDPLLCPKSTDSALDVKLAGCPNFVEAARLFDPDNPDSKAIQRICVPLQENLSRRPEPWLKWLAKPADLSTILAENGGCLVLPINDPRVARFLK